MMFFFYKQKTAYEMRISDWSSDVCSSDLGQSRILFSTEQGSLGCQRLHGIPGLCKGRNIGICNTEPLHLHRCPAICAERPALRPEVATRQHRPEDRKSVVSGKSGSVRVDLGGRRIIKNKNNQKQKK